MKKTIRLTESDLMRIIKRTMNEMMDVSSDSDYYKSRKSEVSIPGDDLGVLLSFAKRFCESQGVRMGDSMSDLEQNAPEDCVNVARLNRMFGHL